jgi:hypothetical protein
MSSAYRVISYPARAILWSRSLRYRLLSSGLNTAPCGVPCPGTQVVIPSRIDALRNASINPSTRLSAMRCRTTSISLPCGIVSKYDFRSTSTVYR